MNAARLYLLLAVALAVSACGALYRTTALKDPLPPSKELKFVGAWNLGDNNCTGAIEAAAHGHYFWVTDCVVKPGYGWCEYGVELATRSPGEYVNEKREWSFTVNADGTLTETRNGKLVGRYAVSPTGVCGATSADLRPDPERN